MAAAGRLGDHTPTGEWVSDDEPTRLVEVGSVDKGSSHGLCTPCPPSVGSDRRQGGLPGPDFRSGFGIDLGDIEVAQYAAPRADWIGHRFYYARDLLPCMHDYSRGAATKRPAASSCWRNMANRSACPEVSWTPASMWPCNPQEVRFAVPR